MTVKMIPLPELNRRAFAILSRELGIPETLRFFSNLGLGAGNYTAERQELFADLTLDEYRQALERMGAKPNTDAAGG